MDRAGRTCPRGTSWAATAQALLRPRHARHAGTRLPLAAAAARRRRRLHSVPLRRLFSGGRRRRRLRVGGRERASRRRCNVARRWRQRRSSVHSHTATHLALRPAAAQAAAVRPRWLVGHWLQQIVEVGERLLVRHAEGERVRAPEHSVAFKRASWRLAPGLAWRCQRTVQSAEIDRVAEEAAVHATHQEVHRIAAPSLLVHPARGVAPHVIRVETGLRPYLKPRSKTSTTELHTA